MARPSHKPTQDNRKTVRTLAGYGIPHDQIAAEIGVSPPTMHKYYQDELDAGLRKANALVVQSLFNKATGDGPQSVTAAIWWTKARMGWAEKNVVDLTVHSHEDALADLEAGPRLDYDDAGAGDQTTH